jgi:hydroxymethylglutaryl-CoA synthase
MAGIVGWGAHLPRYRIKVEEIARIWGASAEAYKKGLNVQEKSVPAPDTDSVTLSVTAARRALARAGVKGADVGACYVGSESHPYAVKPSGTIVAEAIGATPNCRCADFEFACKAGTEGMAVALSMVDSGMVAYALGIGADTSQGAPGDALEYTASAGAAAFLMGRERVVAECEHLFSFMTDTADFWRREHQYYPQHAGRFTGEPAYFKHVAGATKGILEKSGHKPSDFAFCVFHQPNGKFPTTAAKQLGFKPEQWKQGLLCPLLGNTYSGSSPMGLSAILDVAKPGDLILHVSYGSGSGSDGFVFRCTDRITEAQGKAPKTRDLLEKYPRTYLAYGEYAKFRGKIIMNEKGA